LRPLCDLAAICRGRADRLDGETVATRPGPDQPTRGLYVMLCLAAELFEAPVPDAVLAPLRPGDFSEAASLDAHAERWPGRQTTSATGSPRLARPAVSGVSAVLRSVLSNPHPWRAKGSNRASYGQPFATPPCSCSIWRESTAG